MRPNPRSIKPSNRAAAALGRRRVRFAGSMAGLFAAWMAEVADQQSDPAHRPIIDRDLVADAVRLTGPLIFFGELGRVRDGQLELRPARKPHRDRYRDAEAIPIPGPIHVRIARALDAEGR